MTTTRQNAESRAKQLEYAILRIEKGRTIAGVKKLSIAGVAKEAGVTPALIHNHYPDIAEKIRIKLGKTTQARQDANHAAFLKAKDSNLLLKKQLINKKQQIARLVSINETLLLENNALRLATQDNKIKTFPRANKEVQ